MTWVRQQSRRHHSSLHPPSSLDPDFVASSPFEAPDFVASSPFEDPDFVAVITLRGTRLRRTRHPSRHPTSSHSSPFEAPDFVASSPFEAPDFVASSPFEAPDFVASSPFEAPDFVASSPFEAPDFVASSPFEAVPLPSVASTPAASWLSTWCLRLGGLRQRHRRRSRAAECQTRNVLRRLQRSGLVEDSQRVLHGVVQRGADGADGLVRAGRQRRRRFARP